MNTTTAAIGHRNGRLPKDLLDRTPPHDPGAETSLLGSILLEPTRLDEVVGIVDPGHFHVEANGIIYGQIVRLANEGVGIDTLTLADALKAAGQLERIGGAAYLADVLHSVAVSQHAVYHAAIVARKARQRSLIRIGCSLVKAGYDDQGDPDQAHRDALEMLGPPMGVDAQVGAVLRRMADVQREKLDWLWYQRVPMGKLTILAGNPGLGKTLVSMAIAATVSRGALWPERTCSAPLGSVVILTAEDDPADTIRPRLDAAGADVARIHLLESVRVRDPHGKGSHQRTFSLEADLPALEGALQTIGDCKLLIVDPISAYMGRVDSHKNAEVRSVLTPLVELAQRFRVAVLGITHLTKSGGKEKTPAIYRAMGSLAFIAAARAGWAIVKDQADPARRLMLPIKNNLATDIGGLAYRIIEVDGAPVVAWEPEAVTIDVDEALSQPSDEDRSERDEAKQWLREVLADGPVEARKILKMAKDAGHHEKTVRRAKSDLDLIVYKEGFGDGAKWLWKMPAEDGHQTIDTETWPSSQTWPSSTLSGEDRPA